jgi:hypothetical protein
MLCTLNKILSRKCELHFEQVMNEILELIIIVHFSKKNTKHCYNYCYK